MSDTLMIGSLAAKRGQKLCGWLPVPGTSIQLPLTLIHGAQPGPTLLVTAGIHGGEYPGAGDTVRQGQPLGELRGYFGDTLAHIVAPLGGVVLYRVTSLAVDLGDLLVGIGAEAGGER